jgi:hypothetical protein
MAPAYRSILRLLVRQACLACEAHFRYILADPIVAEGA